MGAGRDTGALASFLTRHLGRPVTLTPIRQGLETQAFGCRAGHDDLVLRLAPSDAAFRKDAAIAATFGSPVLPIPAVIEIGTIEDGTAFCLSRRAPGVTLEDLAPVALSQTTAAVTATLETIAAAPIGATSGAGKLDDTLETDADTWTGWLIETLPALAASESAAVRQVHAAVLAALPTCPDVRRLVHGDFGSNNVLVEAAVVTGVIDWSEAMIGDPLYDIANILFWSPWLDRMATQRAALFASRPDWFADFARLVLYQRHIALRELAVADRSNDHEMARFAHDRIASIAHEAASGAIPAIAR
jgi:hygromycin-B 4-O-kinase